MPPTCGGEVEMFAACLDKTINMLVDDEEYDIFDLNAIREAYAALDSAPPRLQDTSRVLERSSDDEDVVLLLETMPPES